MIGKDKFKVLLFVLAMMQFGACANDDGIICTEEFRVIGVEVTGGKLDKWYTVRTSNNDTIEVNSGFENMYAVLDDGFQKEIKNREEEFVFHGIIADSVRIKETFRIKADECHIELVSGRTKVTL